jgi:peptide/nickel transport system permease protein
VIISYILGIFLGAILAWRRGTKMELSAIVVSLFFYSMPVFWFGLVLLWFFAFTLKVLPLQGIGGFDPTSGTAYAGFALVQDILWHMTLPLANLVILGLAGHVLLMRNSMLEVMGEDYILTAKAKGLSERKVMYRHAARNALLPVVTALAISIGGVISGGVLTETIFSWPGMGYFLVTSTLQQDYPSVQAAFFILAVLTILANTVADVLYAWLDPRVRL